MNANHHEEVLRLMSEIWSLSPEVRFGQLLSHIGFLGEAHLGRSLGYIEDDEILTVLRKHLEELEARLPGGRSRHEAVA